MSLYHFCSDCEYVKIKMVPGHNVPMVQELSCPALFNPMEGKWIPKDGVNPHECPRNENFLQVQKQSGERRLR